MRQIRAALLGLLLAALLTAGALAAETVVDSYSARCVVDEHGQGKMTVTVNMTIPNLTPELEFPIGNGTSGIVAGQDSSRVKNDEGAALHIEGEGGFSGSRSFTYSYSMGQVISDVEEGQQLELEIISPGWQWPMDTASFTVVMPRPFEGAPVYLGGYHGDLVEDFWTLSQTAADFSGISNEALLDHDSLRLTLELPADYIKPRAGLSGRVLLILVGVLALLCLLYWFFRLYTPRPGVTPRPDPPKGAGAGDIPALYAGDRPSLPLQVLHWASLGYLKIHLNRKGHVVLRRTRNMGNERRKQERTAFRMLFARDGRCIGGSVRFRRVADRYEAAMGRWWQRKLFSRSGGSPMVLHVLASLAVGTALLGCVSGGEPEGVRHALLLAAAGAGGILAAFVVQEGMLSFLRRRYGRAAAGALVMAAALIVSWLWGSFLAMLPAMALQLLVVLATLRGGRRNRHGQRALVQTMGYRRYLSRITETQLITRLREDGQFFYKALPYAEAMNAGGDFAGQLGDMEIEPCAWLTRERAMPRAGEEFYAVFRDVLQRMERGV